MTPLVLYNVLPTIGNAIFLLGKFKQIRHEFNRSEFEDEDRSFEKTVYFVTSSLFLQIGSQSLGYLAAMAWCGMTVTPIMIVTAYIAAITAIAILALGIAHRPLKGEILAQSIRAVVTIFLSFCFNVTLLKDYEGYQIASSVARAKTNESMKTIEQSITEIFQKNLVPTKNYTRFLRDVLNIATARVIYYSNMSVLGYSKSALIYLENLWIYPFTIWGFNESQNFSTLRALRYN